MKNFDPSIPEETIQMWILNVQRHKCPQSFLRIYQQYHHLATTVCSHHLPNRPQEDVEDTVQAVFEKMWRTHMESFNGEKPQVFGAWLKTVCINRCTDAMRKLSRSITTDDETLSLLTTSATSGVRFQQPTDHIQYTELHQVLEKALCALKPQPQRVLRKHILEGKKYAEIAAELNLTVTNVGYIVSTYIRVLRREIIRLCPEYARLAKR